MTLIDYIFPKLHTEKDVVRQMYKKSRFRRPYDKQHDERSQTLINLEHSTFIIMTDQCEGNS